MNTICIALREKKIKKCIYILKLFKIYDIWILSKYLITAIQHLQDHEVFPH